MPNFSGETLIANVSTASYRSPPSTPRPCALADFDGDLKVRDRGNGVFIVNPFNKQYLAQRAEAGFKPDKSLRYWTPADKAKIEAGINAVEAEMGLNLNVNFDKVDLGASVHNWARKGKVNGHLQGLVKTGRSAIADQLSNHAPDALQSWWREAWDQFAGGEAARQQGSPAAQNPLATARSPVADTVRLYRGQRGEYTPASERSDAGRWFTPDREQAAFYGKIHHVDVPRAEYERMRAEEQEYSRIAPGSNPLKGQGVLLPPESANQAVPEAEQ
jgi:hypothetical protein